MVNETTWGGPSTMSAWEALMWRAEVAPRTRSTGILLEVLESEPAWATVREVFRVAVDQVPRLRERVVSPPVPVVQPFWAQDPAFELDHHLRTERLRGGKDIRALLDHCERLIDPPIDQARAPWEAILITGLSEGRAALAMKFHHSLSDGQGLIQLLDILHSSDLSSESDTAPAKPNETTLVRKVGSDVTRLPGAAVRLARLGLSTVAQVAGNPRGSVGQTASFASSLARMLAPLPIGRSPLLTGGGNKSRYFVIEVSLAEIKAAGRQAEGSVNDAFVAATLGGLRRYHEHHGVRRDRVPMSMPVSVRKAGDPAGGNRFAGIRFAAPMSEADPAARIADIGHHVEALRREPALSFLDHLAPTLTKLPTAAIVELSASLTSSVDLQISNIRGLEDRVSLADAPVAGMFPLGPRPGVAAMVAMITYAGTCCIGVNVDPDVVPDDDVFEKCLRDGFHEVLDLANEAAR